MNDNRRRALRKLAAEIDGILAHATTELETQRDALQDELDAEEEAYDNQPEALRKDEQQEAIDSMQAAVDALQDMIDTLTQGAPEVAGHTEAAQA